MNPSDNVSDDSPISQAQVTLCQSQHVAGLLTRKEAGDTADSPASNHAAIAGRKLGECPLIPDDEIEESDCMTMEAARKPARMLNFEDVEWSELIAADEAPVEFLIRNGVPAYCVVDRVKSVVYRRCKFIPVRGGCMGAMAPAEPVFRYPPFFEERAEDIQISSFSLEGLDEEIAYLRLEENVLAEVDRLGVGRALKFSEGVALYAQYEGDPYCYRNRKSLGKSSSSISRLKFEEAFIVERMRFDSEKKSVFDAPDPRRFATAIEVGKDELYFLSDDIEQCKLQAERLRAERDQEVAYPFDHREQMPGIYWMFQAAYALNERRSILAMERNGETSAREVDTTIKDWLKRRAANDTYGYRSDRTASKFVRLELSRKRGGKNGKGKGRGEFDLNDLEGAEWLVKEVEEYRFDFASGGLSVILAIADWWHDLLDEDPIKTRESLSRRLRGNGFDGGEVDHLEYLIGGFASEGTKATKGAAEKE